MFHAHTATIRLDGRAFETGRHRTQPAPTRAAVVSRRLSPTMRARINAIASRQPTTIA
ncbi:hypothetical protein [Halomarina rubra]|uniref:Uncharacterized protein n=1 Tax=Halomarina rubra TaxID=2071873 RepID=A0ABD6B1Z9_9EURY|nr:hypothetical protein [Halomarina rubra]